MRRIQLLPLLKILCGRTYSHDFPHGGLQAIPLNRLLLDTEWRNKKTNAIIAREYYDHHIDPDENDNVADRREYQSEINRLSVTLSKNLINK